MVKRPDQNAGHRHGYGLPGIAAGAKVKASFGGNSVLTPISNTVKAA
jgi:hypothetical protein